MLHRAGPALGRQAVPAAVAVERVPVQGHRFVSADARDGAAIPEVGDTGLSDQVIRLPELMLRVLRSVRVGFRRLLAVDHGDLLWEKRTLEISNQRAKRSRSVGSP